MSGPRFLLAAAVSLAVVLSAPFIRDIRDFIRATFPGQFVTIVVGVIAVSLLLAVAVALIRIRARRPLRYGAIAAALIFGTAYALWNAQGIADVDAVERFHFVEYGFITLLFYRAWRPRGDASPLVMPIFAGIVVGTLEEWLQWFIPGRIGDMRDVFLNAAAIFCGLLFSLGVDPPAPLTLRLLPASRRAAGIGAAVAVLVFAAFVHTVHLGVEIQDAEAGRFRSRYDAAELLALADARRAEWALAGTLARPASRSREDQYLSEGHTHVQARNNRWTEGDIAAAWCENRILEKYYGPVLTTPSYLSPSGHAWPGEQRVDAERRAGASPGASCVSRADATEGPHFIRTWPVPIFWLSVAALLAGIAGVTAVSVRRGA